MSRSRVLAIAASIPVVACVCMAAWVVLAMPALAAAACPSCYGFTKLADGIFVDYEMSAAKRSTLLSSVSSAKAAITARFGRLSRQPTIVACSTETCDKRLGGKGAKAITYSFPGGSVWRVSPRGLNRTIVTHEFAHVEVHARIGVANHITGTVPAWFDEGLAVIISEDDRYLKRGASAAERCKQSAAPGLPVSPFEWASRAGKSHTIYAGAACAVLHWLEENGGNAGLLAALEEVAHGRRRLP